VPSARAWFKQIKEEAGRDGQRTPAVPDDEHVADQGQPRDQESMKPAALDFLLDGVGGQDGARSAQRYGITIGGGSVGRGRDAKIVGRGRAP